MVEYWEPGTQYDYGAVVIYEDVEYEIIQPHRSQGDWTPQATPALWGRRQRHHGHQNDTPQYEKPAYEQPSYEQPYEQQPEGEKHWYDGHKKELEIGAGLLAVGAAAAGGYAYTHRQKSSEGYEQPPQEKQGENKEHWYDGHKKELEIGAGVLATGAAVAGYKGYKHHQQTEGEYEQPPQEQHGENKEHWYDGHKKELEIGGGVLAVGAAVAGYKAYKHHQQAEGEYEQPPQEQHGENKQHWYDGHKKELEIGGVLAAGAAIAGGYKAYKHHQQEEAEE